MNTINKVKRQMTNRQKTFHHISQRIISLLNIVFLKIEKIKIQQLDRKVNQWYKFSSVAQSCPTLCDPTSCSMPGLPVHHQLPEFTQTHDHRVSDAIQSSHPLSPPSPAAPNPSQHQGLFQWVNSSHEVAKVLVSASASVLPMNTQTDVF